MKAAQYFLDEINEPNAKAYLLHMPHDCTSVTHMKSMYAKMEPSDDRDIVKALLGAWSDLYAEASLLVGFADDVVTTHNKGEPREEKDRACKALEDASLDMKTVLAGDWDVD